MAEPIPFRRRKAPAPKPPRELQVLGEPVTAEERAAADEHLRNAQALQRLFDRPWATPETLRRAPDLIASARKALDTLEDLVG